MKKILSTICLIVLIVGSVVYATQYTKKSMFKKKAIAITYECIDEYERLHSGNSIAIDTGSLHELSGYEINGYELKLKADKNGIYYCDGRKKLPLIKETDIKTLSYFGFKAHEFLYFVSEIFSKGSHGYKITKTNKYDVNSFECGKNDLEYLRDGGREYVYCKDKNGVYLVNSSGGSYGYSQYSLIELKSLMPSKFIFSGSTVRYNGGWILYGSEVPKYVQKSMLGLASDCVAYPTADMSKYRFCSENDIWMYVNSGNSFVEYRSFCNGVCDGGPLYGGKRVKFSKETYKDLLY